LLSVLSLPTGFVSLHSPDRGCGLIFFYFITGKCVRGEESLKFYRLHLSGQGILLIFSLPENANVLPDYSVSSLNYSPTRLFIMGGGGAGSRAKEWNSTSFSGKEERLTL
jgi:hypothetical protein